MLSAKDGAKQFSVHLAITATMLASASALAGQAHYETFQTHSHIIFPVDPGVIYSVEKVMKNGKQVAIRVTFTGVQEDLGELDGLSDYRTEKVRVSRVQGDSGQKIVYEFRLSQLAQDLGIEYFDFRNKVPSEITLDYWTKPAKTAAGKVAQKAPVKQARKVVSRSKAIRHVASNFVGCGHPMDLDSDPFVNWKVYHRPYDYRAYFKLMPADATYEYPFLTPAKNEALSARTKEIAHYRLAFKLYKEAKYALVLRTIDFFEAQYQSSTLRPELDFLRASTMVQLSRLLRTTRYLDQALDTYRRILLEGPDTERGKLALGFQVQELMDRGTPIFALEYALMGAERKGKDAKDLLPWVYRLASAEALFALGELDRAERAYQVVMDQDNALSPEAAYRIGEVFAAGKQWERAVLSYETALKRFPKEANRFSSTWFNLAEANFRLGRFAEAERVYKEFDSRFPNDELAWAGRLRVAAIQQIAMKAPDAKQHDGIQALYEGVVNRHPYSPGAMMAELRLSECFMNSDPSDPGYLRNKEFFTSFFANRDLKKFESAIVDLGEVERWMDLTEARFFVATGDYRAALKRADQYRDSLGRMPFKDSFRKVFAEATEGLIVSLAKSEKENSEELLAAVEHYGTLAPKPESIGYVLSVAKAQQKIGNLPPVSLSLSTVEGRLSDAKDHEKDLFRLLKGRQRRLLGEQADQAIVEFEQIRDSGEFGAVKYDELATSALSKGDVKAAVAYDSKVLDTPLATRLTSKRQFELAVRRLENVARIESPAETAKLASRVLFKYGTQTDQPEQLARVNELRAQALFESGNFLAAEQALGEILKDSTGNPRQAEFEFMLGKCLAKLGRDAEALETFRRVAQANNSGEVWRKSAQAELDQIQWEKQMSKLIKDRRSYNDRNPNE